MDALRLKKVKSFSQATSMILTHSAIHVSAGISRILLVRGVVDMDVMS
jgi:hypothetical protein